MPDLVVFRRWWKRIFGITFLATGVAIVAALLLPPKFISTATALPASSMATDKAAIFNTNIQQLYSSLGSPDDLDRIVGTAQLDTIFIATAIELNLAEHYNLSDKKNALHTAMQKLKRQSEIRKSEWGELKIKVWDRNGVLAAQAANTLLEKLQALHQNLQNQSNKLVLQKLEEIYHPAPLADSVFSERITTSSSAIAQLEQRQQYERLLAEYKMVVATNPPVLLVVEPARQALQPDRTEKQAYILITFFAALVFSGLLALYTEGQTA